MKFILFILFFFSCFNSKAQDQEATLYFNDGTIVKGYGSIHQNYKIKFRASLDDKPDVWTDIMVKGITFHGFEENLKYEYHYKNEEKSYPLLLEVLTEGEVTLYADVYSQRLIILSLNRVSSSNISLNSLGNPLNQGFFDTTTSNLYLKRKNEDLVTSLSGNFKKKVREYFGECIGFNKKLDNYEFRKATAVEMVIYYNDFCIE